MIKILSVILAFVLAVTIPIELTIFGPLLFGLAHVVSDFQFLLLRSELSTEIKKIILGTALVMVLLLGLGHASFVPFCGVAGLLATTLVSTNFSRAMLVVLGAGLYLVSTFYWPIQSNQTLIIGHNFVALMIWALYFSNDNKNVLWVFFLTVLGAALISTQANMFSKVFVFLQLVHYLVWLKWIPDFEMATKKWLIGGAVVGAGFTLFAYQTSDPIFWKEQYLLFFQFHVYLELMVLAYLYVKNEKIIALKAEA